ncbi:MAG: PD-(D/E)XK nuclease family protein [Candidatus Omnitrophica bacterium]|nr:PD-(D/E)XK nuclease family protein [Candidatus Omnitrophota bacterium]
MDKLITFSFRDNYLEKLTDYIQQNYASKGGDLSRLAVVFGGKRPALFLKRHLAKKIGRHFYPPKMFAIDQFIADIVKSQETVETALDLDHCYLLFRLAKEITPQILKGREDFAQFLPWAKEILSFIDQLDLENVDNKDLLGVEANAQIGYDVPEDINKMLESVTVLREGYHQKLMRNKKYSRGFQYLRAAELVEEIDFNQFDQILFCNFFYFNRTEEIIIKRLFAKGKATLIFQGDERKWPILKRLAHSFGGSILEGKKPDDPQFKLNLYSAFDGHSEVSMVREITKKIKNLENTVIVLPHPEPIVPLLSGIAGEIKDFNISMGYPLKRSSLYYLFDFIFQAQLSKKEGRYYSRDYLKILRHPFIKNLELSAAPEVTRVLIHKLEEILIGKERSDISGSVFIGLQEIEDLDDLYDMTAELLKRMNIDISKENLKTIMREVHQLALKDWEGVHNFQEFAGFLKNLLDVLVARSTLKNYPLNLNIAKKMYDLQEELCGAAFRAEKFSAEEVFRIFRSKVESEIVAFHGSPLKGMQILGLFETRSLNFENVIVMDVNEGLLPSLRIQEPLIPREVMMSLDLNRIELEEEIQRYQFMRLISSAKNVHLVYKESRDKERSRFVEELIWEKEKKKNKVGALSARRPRFAVNIAREEKVIQKTPAMIEMLRQHTYSASSVNMYLRDPLEFYYTYVLRLKEMDDLLDEPEARQVGTFIHELLEDSFKVFLNKKPDINASFRQHFKKILEQKFARTFARSMKADAFLVKAVLEERLERFLDNEAENPQRRIAEILFLEKQFTDTIALKCGDIKFKYIVDRVDRYQDGTVMVIDYKTGSVDQMPKNLNLIERMTLSRENVFENIRSFQLPLYYHYLSGQYAKNPINAVLYNLKTIEFKKFDKEGEFEREHVNAVFLEALNFVFEEIFDPSVPFVKGENL